MITLTKLRDLTLTAPASAGRPLHLSAASGLSCLGAHLYVVADDELHLGVFGVSDSAPGRLVRLFDGELPDPPLDRKKAKPDLEALTLLPAFGDFAHGALLAVGSGSKKNRRTGALLALDAQGALREAPRLVDLAPLLKPLKDEFAKPNIEGAAVSGGELRLLQRGNKRETDNAVVRFSLASVLDALMTERADAIRPVAIDRFALGEVEGIPLCFTDATALPGGAMLFTAVAEDTDDPYDDGRCAGAAIGLIAADGGLPWIRPLDAPHKVEGVDARIDGDAIRLLLVTDADDANVPANLFAAAVAK